MKINRKAPKITMDYMSINKNLAEIIEETDDEETGLPANMAPKIPPPTVKDMDGKKARVIPMLVPE